MLLLPANPLDAPPVMMIHGFDSSVLEFRFMLPELVEAGLEVHACDWWTGGFTQRKPGLDAIEANPALQPWDIIREQNYAARRPPRQQRPRATCEAANPTHAPHRHPAVLEAAARGAPRGPVRLLAGGAAAIDFAVAHQRPSPR